MIDALLKTPFATLIDTQTRLLVVDTQFHPLPGVIICRSSNEFFFFGRRILYNISQGKKSEKP